MGKKHTCEKGTNFSKLKKGWIHWLIKFAFRNSRTDTSRECNWRWLIDLALFINGSKVFLKLPFLNHPAASLRRYTLLIHLLREVMESIPAYRHCPPPHEAAHGRYTYALWATSPAESTRTNLFLYSGPLLSSWRLTDSHNRRSIWACV